MRPSEKILAVLAEMLGQSSYKKKFEAAFSAMLLVNVGTKGVIK